MSPPGSCPHTSCCYSPCVPLSLSGDSFPKIITEKANAGSQAWKPLCRGGGVVCTSWAVPCPGLNPSRSSVCPLPLGLHGSPGSHPNFGSIRVARSDQPLEDPWSHLPLFFQPPTRPLPLLPQPLTVLEGALVQTVPAQRPLCKADINISLRGWQGVSLQPMGHLGVPTPHCRCARPCPMGFTHTHGRSIALTRVPELPRRPGQVGWSATLRWAGPGHCLGQQGVVMVWRVDLGLQGL